MIIIAGKAVWQAYPQVDMVVVRVLQPRKDISGQPHDTEVIVARYSRATGALLPYLHLLSQPKDDNKKMLCNADSYSVAVYIWGQLKDKGCMTAPTGGTR